MITLTDIVRLSREEILTELFSRENALTWDICNGLASTTSASSMHLKREYPDFKKAVDLSLASYFLSFLALFFSKKGGTLSADMLNIDPLEDILDYLANIHIRDDKFYHDLQPSEQQKTVRFLNRWLTGDLPFSAKNARENLILDLLIRFDTINGTRLSSRLLHDIFYLVHSLAMHDEDINHAEQELLGFLQKETAKVKSVIGDDTVFELDRYTSTLTEKNREELLQEARQELGELIGLDGIKTEFTKLEAFLRIQQRRRELELAITSLTLHFVFRGNPGTGKTTVARILGKLFSGVGFLEKGHVVETDRSGLVAEYLGQTAVKTRTKAEEAMEGILFIDEAYALSRGKDGTSGSDAYGQEAVETILKFMEDNRQSIVVVVAGYPKLMNDFIATNPGLKSRFTRYLDFEDFTPIQLCQIMQLFAKKGQYTFTDQSVVRLAALFADAHATKKDDFGNARFVRNIFEKTLQNQAMRLTTTDEPASKEQLMTIIPADLPEFNDSENANNIRENAEPPWCGTCTSRQAHCPTSEKDKKN